MPSLQANDTPWSFHPGSQVCRCFTLRAHHNIITTFSEKTILAFGRIVHKNRLERREKPAFHATPFYNRRHTTTRADRDFLAPAVCKAHRAGHRHARLRPHPWRGACPKDRAQPASP